MTAEWIDPTNPMGWNVSPIVQDPDVAALLAAHKDAHPALLEGIERLAWIAKTNGDQLKARCDDLDAIRDVIHSRGADETADHFEARLKAAVRR